MNTDIKTKTNRPKAGSAAVEAWDLYCAGRYETIVERFQQEKTSELQSMIALAHMEMPVAFAPADSAAKSLFGPLQSAMRQWHQRQFPAAARELGDWLLKKDYFSEIILDRFCIAAERSAEWHYVIKVAQKYFQHSRWQSRLAPVFLQALYGLDKHKEVISFFEKHRELLDQESSLQKVALSYLACERYDDAENLLLPLYQRINGQQYQMHFEEVRQKYSDRKMIQKLARKKDKSPGEVMELGLSLLFQGEYKQALQLFEKLYKIAA
ncbi:MAG: hypothetical protein KDK39_05185 [Leptospiraceae bacterium]|nr:hypothetical protein [Leptospiraceae bacterium]